MIDHDATSARLLDLLDELGLAEDTIVVYSTDNGPHMNTWPDGGMTPVPQREEHELGRRVPRPADDPLARQDRGRLDLQRDRPAPRLAADVPRRRRRARTSSTSSRPATIGDETFKVHIDGYNLLPYLTGEVEKSPRPGLVYFSDDGDVLALRFDNWKVVFMEQRAQGTLQIWAEPFVSLRVPKLFNLRTDPFERADVTSNTYYDWLLENDYIILAAMGLVTQFLATFEEFPPRQKAASFTIDQVVEKLEAVLTSGR